MRLNYGGLLDASTIDYPGCVSAVVFTCGCPLRCGFCQNASLVLNDAKACRLIETSELLARIRRIRPFLDALVLTGGEPLMQADAALEICVGAKKMGLRVKIDTNGFYPNELKRVLPHCDYVAMDVKTRLDADAYKQIAGFGGSASDLLSRVEKSMKLLDGCGRFVEFRTTIVEGVNDGEQDVRGIAEKIRFCDLFALQQFRSAFGTLDGAYAKHPQTRRGKLAALAKVALDAGVKNVHIRTQEAGDEKING
jgi:pyruvate formate lyase activating enzyme